MASIYLIVGKNERVRFSYAKVFTATVPENSSTGLPEFSTAILIPKTLENGDVNPDVEAIENAIKQIVADEKNGKFKGVHASKLGNPLNDGDIKFEEDEEKYAAYEGHYYLSAKRKVRDERRDKVIVLDQYGRPIKEEDNVFFSGCYGAAKIALYPYNTAGNKGVAVSLEAVQYKSGTDADRLASVSQSIASIANEFGCEEEDCDL